MKLKARVHSLDELNQMPEQYRDRYTPSEDGKSWALDEIEIEDTVGLKESHTKLMRQHNAVKEELKAIKAQYGDIDPEKARAAQQKLEELENKQLMDEGKFEELFTKRTEAMKRDHQNQMEATLKTLEEQKARAATLEKELQHTVIANDLSTRAASMNIDAGFLPLLHLQASKDWVLNEEGKKEWRVDGQLKYGKDPAKPADMGDYLTEMVAKMPGLVKGSHGTGANGNTGRSGTGLTISAAELHGDVRKYEAIKKQAQDMKIPMTQVVVTE